MYSNCLFVALIHKIKNPKIKIYLIKSRMNSRGFHVMWKDNNKVFHFTRIKGYDVRCEWWFKGQIVELRPNTIEKLNGIRIL